MLIYLRCCYGVRHKLVAPPSHGQNEQQEDAAKAVGSWNSHVHSDTAQ